MCRGDFVGKDSRYHPQNNLLNGQKEMKNCYFTECSSKQSDHPGT